MNYLFAIPYNSGCSDVRSRGSGWIVPEDGFSSADADCLAVELVAFIFESGFLKKKSLNHKNLCNIYELVNLSLESGKILKNPAHCSNVFGPIDFTSKRVFTWINCPCSVRWAIICSAFFSVNPATLLYSKITFLIYQSNLNKC